MIFKLYNVLHLWGERYANSSGGAAGAFLAAWNAEQPLPVQAAAETGISDLSAELLSGDCQNSERILQFKRAYKAKFYGVFAATEYHTWRRNLREQRVGFADSFADGTGTVGG